VAYEVTLRVVVTVPDAEGVTGADAERAAEDQMRDLIRHTGTEDFRCHLDPSLTTNERVQEEA
jgi:hypothetical protein